jgi:hypothetical protein
MLLLEIRHRHESGDLWNLHSLICEEKSENTICFALRFLTCFNACYFLFDDPLTSYVVCLAM